MLDRQYFVSLPYSGSIENWLDSDGTIPFNLGVSANDYMLSKMRQGKFLVLVNGATMDKLDRCHLLGLHTAPTAITPQRWDDMLNVLPPCRWHNNSGYSVFHVVERLAGNVVSWFALSGDRAYTFDNEASLSESQIANILKGI
ncbi:hypothetical protein NVP2096O_06 [Vibrio phage 2.096.O._10N.286.48.B5]|nr:hypothetical protein NVP2096O_06 [Vibrio phage 2.096.O._10N.286.48.B5]